MNRLEFDNDKPGGFANKRATGKMPDPKPEPLFLNLGCGNDIKDGFVNIDLFSNDPRVVGMDVRKLDIPNNSADLIYASDILEHFSHREVDSVLREWARVLKPGGEIMIRCPSLSLQVKAYTEKLWNADIASYMIFGGQTNPGDYHCIAFDKDSITRHLEAAGFDILQISEQDIPQDRGYINLNMTIKAVKRQFDNSATLEEIVFGEKEEELLQTKAESGKNIPQINIVWEGSQFVNHSFALVNRENCLNIIDCGQAELTIVPYEKDQFGPGDDPKLNKLAAKDIRVKEKADDSVQRLPYCWIRHQWPPKAEAPKGAKWIIMQPWEFTSHRKDLLEIFEKAHEIWTPSNYSRQSFIDSGLDFNKVQVIPNGIDPVIFSPDGLKVDLNTTKRFKLLYVGGTIYRKGIDILLDSYIETFRRENDICLVIKDMGGDSFYKGQTAKARVNELQADPDMPEIIYIDQSISEIEMASLYRTCDLFVSPYRGEGFSLPTLEAMACGLPVVVTDGGATDDFVDDNCGWKIPAESKSIGDTLDGNEMTGEAFLLEPIKEELSYILNNLFTEPAELKAKGLYASYKARSKWTWKKATSKLLKRLDAIYETQMAVNSLEALTDKTDSILKIAESEFECFKNNTEKAIAILEEVLNTGNINPNFKMHAINRLALLYIESGRYHGAESLIKNANGMAKSNPDTDILLALLKKSKGDFVGALDVITPVLNSWKTLKYSSSAGFRLDDLLCFTGDIMLEMEDPEGAHQVYTEALRYNEECYKACYGAAKCFIMAGVNNEARTMLEWALKLNPEFKEAEELLKNL